MKKERRTFAKKRSPEGWSFSPGISRGRRRIEEEEEEEERERERLIYPSEIPDNQLITYLMTRKLTNVERTWEEEQTYA